MRAFACVVKHCASRKWLHTVQSAQQELVHESENIMKTSATHPVATLSQLLFSHHQPATRALLHRPDLELTYSARGALYFACAEVAAKGRREILVPAFHCPSGITPAIAAGLKPVFYRVRRDMSIDFDDLLSKVGPQTGAVMIIHFYGFSTNMASLQSLRQQGIALLEDWSHSFLQNSPPELPVLQGDYQVFSFWKLVPSVVGGGLLRREPAPEPIPAKLRTPFRESAVRIKKMIESALEHSPHRRTHALVQKLEAWRVGLRHVPDAGPAEATGPDADAQSHAVARGEDYPGYGFDMRLARSEMPGTARRILESADLAQVAKRRRDNYDRYAQLLRGDTIVRPLFPQRPAECCPWVFPVLLSNRNRIDREWRAAGVALHTFGIYLHSALDSSNDSVMVGDAHFLAQETLCLCIHQDLETQDISRSASTILTHKAARAKKELDQCRTLQKY